MSNELKTYDLVIIGGGPAGVVGAATAKAAHKTVALVDNHHELGGAGVNTGTVPSKTLARDRTGIVRAQGTPA